MPVRGFDKPRMLVVPAPSAPPWRWEFVPGASDPRLPVSNFSSSANWLNEQIVSGTVRRRDVKPRVGRVSVFPGLVRFEIGFTLFPWIEHDQRLVYLGPRRQLDTIRRQARKERGDSAALFSRSLGVTAILQTVDGALVLGEKRLLGQHPYLHGVGGYCEFFDTTLSECARPILDPERDLHRELVEEIGVRQGGISAVEFLALAEHPLGLGYNLVFLVKVRESRRSFERRFYQDDGSTATSIDCHPLRVFTGLGSVKPLLRRRNVFYAARAGLEALNRRVRRGSGQ